MTWHPRGEPTWPDWRKAAPGTRFEHVRSGRQGTFVKASRHRNNGAIIDWDPTSLSNGKPVRAYVVAPAFDLRPVGGNGVDESVDSDSRDERRR